MLRFLTGRATRVIALAALWAGLTATTSKEPLVPEGSSAMILGKDRLGDIREVDDAKGAAKYGKPPLLQREAFTAWWFHWNGKAYKLMGPDMDEPTDVVFAPLAGHRDIYVMQIIEQGTSAEGEGREVNYVLVWRRAGAQLVGFRDFFSDSPCEALGVEKTRALGLTEEEAQKCEFHDWAQLEAVFAAYAATRPEPIGAFVPFAGR